MSLKDFLLDCLFPKKCYGCGAPDTWLCRACFLSLQHYQGEAPRALENSHDLIIAGEYKDILLQNLILAFKFQFNRELVIPLFYFLKLAIDKKIILDRLSQNPWQNILIIPIPLHKKRKKWRGFNQSELLAKEINNYYGWPLYLDLIKKTKTLTQAELSEEARLTNQIGSFSWRGPSLINRDIILVDDIITSGATMNEAAKILKMAGARRIFKVAIAKG